MGKRRKHVSKKKEDRLMISKRRTRSSSKSKNILEQIPVDIIIQILSKLSLKSIARFRCVSKEWNSILRSSDFTNLFLEVSSSRSRLLFSVLTEDKKLFFSAPQPLNRDKNSTHLTTDYMCSPLILPNLSLLDPVYGLMFTVGITFKRGCNDSKVMIYNPSTRQSIRLPIMRGRRDYAVTYFGYDPINQQYKVLCLSMRRDLVFEHEVLTLGTKKPAWKMIECSLPRYYPSSPICINGVLYYLGETPASGLKTIRTGTGHDNRVILVFFDVSSEKFNFIETDDKVTMPSKLIIYKGKLSVTPYSLCSRETTSFELLILDNVEKNKWSHHIYVLPPLWKDLVGDMTLKIVGMTGNGELVFSRWEYYPFYIFFYNVEKNTIARVRINGMESRKIHYIQTFIDHVENVKLI